MTTGAGAAPPLVLVTVGTDHHPFDRVVRWVASWPGQERVRLVVQSGTSATVPGLDCRPQLPAGELDRLVAEAAVVVCHGGPGSVLQARAAGRLPIVVPRRPELGEHVDDHQVRFASWVADRGLAVVAHDEAALHAALDRALAEPAAFAVELDGTDRSEVAARFGDLVEALVRNAARRPRRFRRRRAPAG